MNIDVNTVIDLLNEKLPPEVASEMVSELNQRLKEIKAEEEADKDESEKGEKKEFNFYVIHDENMRKTEGVAPQFIVKVPAEFLPTDAELFLQHAINEIKNANGKKKKRKGKGKSTLANLHDLAHMAKPAHFDTNKRVFFVSKEPVCPLPVNVTF